MNAFCSGPMPADFLQSTAPSSGPMIIFNAPTMWAHAWVYIYSMLRASGLMDQYILQCSDHVGPWAYIYKINALTMWAPSQSPPTPIS